MSDKQKHKSYFSNNGHLTDLSVAHVVDALLYNQENKLPREIKEHISNCQECQLNIIESYEIMSNERLSNLHPFFSVKESNVGEKNKPGFQTKNILRIAATALIVISIGIIGILLKRQPTKKISDVSSDSIMIDTSDSGIKTDELIVNEVEPEKERKKDEYKDTGIKKENTQDKNLIARIDLTGKEYKLSVTQVAMLGNIMRSDYFELTSPKDSTIFGLTEAIDFSWDSQIKENLILSIYNNNEKLVFKNETITENNLTFRGKLDNGVYLWHLESEDDIIYTGVFFICDRNNN